MIKKVYKINSCGNFVSAYREIIETCPVCLGLGTVDGRTLKELQRYYDYDEEKLKFFKNDDDEIVESRVGRCPFCDGEGEINYWE